MLTLAALVFGLLPGLPLRAGVRQPHAALVTSSNSRATPVRLAAYTPFSRTQLEGVDGAATKDHFVFKTNDMVRIDTEDYCIELFRNRTSSKLDHTFTEKPWSKAGLGAEWAAFSREQQANHICNFLEGSMDDYAASVGRDLASLGVASADIRVQVHPDAVWELALPADKYSEQDAKSVESKLSSCLRMLPETRPRPTPRKLEDLSVGTVLSPVFIGPASGGEFLKGAYPKKYGKGYMVDIGVTDEAGECVPAFLPGFECTLNPGRPRGGGWVNFSAPGMPLGTRMQVIGIEGDRVNVSVAAYMRQHAWDQVKMLSENGFPYDATLLSFTEAGAIADVEGLPGFIPWSHWYLPEEKREPSELEALKGQTLTVEFLEIDPQRRRLVLSRRKHLLERKRAQIAPGQLVEGVIAAIRPYGAVVRLSGELDGFSGLLHISQLSGAFVKNVTQVFEVDDFVRSVVIKVDQDDGSIALSTKMLEGKAGDMLKNKEALFAKVASKEPVEN